MVTTGINPYLDGNFAPVQEEVTTEIQSIIGELPPDLSGMFVRNGPNPQFPPIGAYHWFDGDGMLHRWRFHLPSGTVQEEPLDDHVSEFPRINENWLGRPNRYGYTSKMASDRLPLFTGIIKHDLQQNRQYIHEFGSGRFGGEAVFAPRPGATQEDEGWLITFVYDSHQDCSELLVVNAQDMNGEPVTRVILPQRVPYGFHGIWLQE